MSYSPSPSDAASTESTRRDIEYEYGTVEEFLQLDNIVQYLFDTALLNDIECRGILCLKGPDVVKIRAAIFDIMFTKDSITFKKILEVFRNRVHPFQNPKILLQIFSYLKYADIFKCKFVSLDWKQIIDMIVSSKHDEVSLEEHLMIHLLSNNEEIQNTKIGIRKEERKAAVFQMMLAKNPEKDDSMLEMLQIGRDVPDVNSTSIKVSCTAEYKMDILIAKALNNHTVLSNVFQFLSLENIKNCRTVCRTWYSVSEPFLRKISIIIFHSKLAPIDLLNVAKYLPLPGLPFKSFKFQKVFSTEELSEFFTKYGKNVQSLKICLGKDVRLCLSCTTNLTELNLEGVPLKRLDLHPKTDPMIMIPWSSLQSIKILSLKASVIKIDSDKEWRKIIPVKLHLDQVSFFVGGCYPDEIMLNDYIDFTKVRDVYVDGNIKQARQFDWAKDTFDAERITFEFYTSFVNARKSKSAVHYLKLYCQDPFSEKKLNVFTKQLIVEETSISLTALPPSMEKLGILGEVRESITSMDGMGPLYLPNLNYLSFRKTEESNLLSNFVNCPNLTDMEIWVTQSMDLQWLPRNIKRLRVDAIQGPIKFVDGLANKYVNLDLLILNHVSSNNLKYLEFDKLRPKILVVEVLGPYNDEDFVSFIRSNKNMDKIYVKYHHNRYHRPKKPIAFSTTKLSNIVDRESIFYEFSNQRGKAITSEEYLTIRRSLNIKTVMKEFWNTDEKERGNQLNQQRGKYYKRFLANEGEQVSEEEESNNYSSDSFVSGWSLSS